MSGVTADHRNGVTEMKKQTLAPAVLASITAVGLVLAPVAATAQETDPQDTVLADEATDSSSPTPTEQESTSPAEPAPSESAGDQDPKPEDDGTTGQDDTDEEADEDAERTESPEDPEESSEPGEEETQGDEDGTAADAEVSVDPGTAQLTDVVHFSGEAAPAGVTISATGLEADDDYTLTISGGTEPTVTETLTASASGTADYAFVIAVDSDADLSSYAGDRSVTLSDSEGADLSSGTFTIEDDSEDEAPPATDPALQVRESIAVDDVMVPEGEEPGDRGLPITATGLEPGESYTFRVVAPAENSDLSTEFVASATEEGTASGSYYIEWTGDYNADAIAGMFRIDLVDADDEVLDTADVEFVGGSDDGSDDEDDNGSDDSDDSGDDADGNGDGDSDEGQPGEDDSDDADVDPSVTVSPQKLSAANFMNYDKGVQVTASDCLPGDTVSLEVYWPGTNEVAYADGIEADEDGTASFSFYGTGSNASDYVGTWKVAISCGGETVTDTFTVTGSQADDGRSGSDLPRTGSDAGILAIVATSLLTVGAATVMISSRPKRRNTL